VTTVEALLVTERGQQPALLFVEEAAGQTKPVLIVDGVARAPEDLPAGAYLKVDDPEMADRAVLAGYATEPPRTATRRRHRILGRVYATGLLVGAVGSIYWVVRDLLELDLLGALAWVGLSIFLGALGLFWWFAGEEIGLGEDAEHRQRARAFWAAAKGLFGSGGRKR